MVDAIVEVFYSTPALFIWGACWGSFLNVVMYRFPRGLSIVYPPSACPGCAKPIAAYDNIPVMSWFLLRGRCRHCGARFSVRYALTEAVCGGVFASAGALYPQHWIMGLSLGTALWALVPAIYLLARYKKSPWYLWAVGLGASLFYAAQIFEA